MKVLLAVALLAVVLVSFASASCKSRPTKFMKHRWSAKLTPYCKYRGMKYGVGSHFTDLKRCKKCDCTMYGLSCCGIGYYAGIQVVPGCIVLPDKCETAILNPKTKSLCQPIPSSLQ